MANRTADLERIWAKMGSDYRITRPGGERAIMVLRDGITTLVSLEGLRDSEIEYLLPKK